MGLLANVVRLKKAGLTEFVRMAGLELELSTVMYAAHEAATRAAITTARGYSWEDPHKFARAVSASYRKAYDVGLGAMGSHVDRVYRLGKGAMIKRASGKTSGLTLSRIWRPM